MKIIFEKDMRPELISIWSFYSYLNNELANLLGPPEKPLCHCFIHTNEEGISEQIVTQPWWS